MPSAVAPTPVADPPVPTAGDYDERFDELARLAYRVAFRIVGRREEARDLTQEAMARAFARWPHVRDNAAGWVSRVATNLALDVVRRRGHVEPHRPVPATDIAGDTVRRAELVDALRALPRRQREVVALRYLADLPEAEVARTLGCRVGTVKQHASRGLAALRAALHDDERRDGSHDEPRDGSPDEPHETNEGRA